MLESEMKLGLIIASHGRPDFLQKVLTTIMSQRRIPDEIVISAVVFEDIPKTVDTITNVRRILGSTGLTSQRNRGISSLIGTADVIIFIDDDFIVGEDYFLNLESIFELNDSIVGVTGEVIADGADSSGLKFEQGLELAEQYSKRAKAPHFIREIPGTYGCNMAFRTSSVGSLRFDERLALYGWQEDLDFSGAMRANGRIVKTNRVWGVHLGTKRGKGSDIRLGYSQIINPAYIASKGNMSIAVALRLTARNFLANLVKSIRPESYIDRRGRLRGNLIGVFHLLTGRLTPEYILQLEKTDINSSGLATNSKRTQATLPSHIMKLGLVIASHGRPTDLKQTLAIVMSQRRVPDYVVISAVHTTDIPQICQNLVNVRTIFGSAGLTGQRNRGISYLIDKADLISFIDDDFIVGDDYFHNMEKIFLDDDSIVGLNAEIIADGANLPGYTFEEGLRLAEEFRQRKTAPVTREVSGKYADGCNGIITCRTARLGSLRFDERLPLYGWQEDLDFCVALRRCGRIVKTNQVWGVHLGIKHGKGSDLRLGYSQIVNPVYILCKGNMSVAHAFRLTTGNFLANLVKSILPENYINRRGRLRGNLIGLFHLLTGRLNPENILEMK
jgi:GT2 family glycosyltransferase